jgi:probable phosphoglycerate mutase
MIVRHGESEWNAGRLLQGQADIDLSERGRAQAAALADTVNKLAPDTVMSSDLKRAMETAHILGYTGAVSEIGLREIDVGRWMGRPIAELKAQDLEAYRGWRAGTYTPPGGESWAMFVARTTGCVKTAFESCEKLLIVCHGGVIRALLENLIGLPPSRIIPVGPASLTVLAQPGTATDHMRLELFNYSPLGPVLDAPD